MKQFLLSAALLGLVSGLGSAAIVTLDNGLAGTSQYSVDIDENAYSTSAWIQAPGQAVDNLMYEYIPYLDIGGASARLGSGVWVDSNPGDGSVTSSGATSGINWSVTHTLPAGGTIMTSRYTLTSPTGALLPAMRFYQYLDEDVYGVWNILVVSGSIAGADLDLLTIEPTIGAGVSQAGDASATGWVADEYADLRSLLETGGYDAPAWGYVDTADLPSHVDPTYGPAYGPTDITTAIEWEVPAGLQVYAFEAYLGGLPEVPPVIPEPATLALLLAGAGALTRVVRRRRAK